MRWRPRSRHPPCRRKTKRFGTRSPSARMSTWVHWSSSKGSWLDKPTASSTKVVHVSHQPTTSVPFPDDPADEASRPGVRNLCGWRDYNRWRVCAGGAQAEGVCTACEKPRPEPHTQGWEQGPHLGPAGARLPQGLWHGPALWSSQKPRGVQAFCKVPEILHSYTEPYARSKGDVGARQRPTAWLWKLTPDLPCYLRDFGCWKKKEKETEEDKYNTHKGMVIEKKQFTNFGYLYKTVEGIHLFSYLGL